MTHAVVGFRPAAADAHPFQALLRRGYAHCWMAREIDTGLWLWLEWTPERLVHGLVHAELVTEEMDRCSEVLGLAWPGPGGLRPREARGLPRPALCCCVSVVADAIGLRVPLWATPWRLSGALRSHGAWVITRRKVEVEC
jgi:hypothetical protein